MSDDNHTPKSDVNSSSKQKLDPAAVRHRRKVLLSVTVVVVLAALAFGAYEWLLGGRYETTDNAYVQGNVIQITPRVEGTVQAIYADDMDFVKAGQVLVRLDPADAHIRLEHAEAQLAQAVRQARTLYADNETLNAQIALRQAEVVKARSDLARAEDDRKRRTTLASNGAVSREELRHAEAAAAAARSTLVAAEAAVVAAREQLSSNQSLTDGTDVIHHPAVLAAAAAVREAYLANERMAVLAPTDGYVARRTVQLGQRVSAGSNLMTVVPLRDVWVEANFKENQLRGLRLGQEATLTADLYGTKVRYTGKITGLGVGTGAAFALLPAQNATGNWIKVVQRVPVRIELTGDELTEHPLRVGLSMDVKVNVGDKDGGMLANAPRTEAFAQTDVFRQQEEGADAAVSRIVAANLGAASAGAKLGMAAPAAGVN